MFEVLEIEGTDLRKVGSEDSKSVIIKATNDIVVGMVATHHYVLKTWYGLTN